jgi:hypothetical protein
VNNNRRQRGGLSPAQRVLQSRMGGYATAARNDPPEYTARARARFLQRFEELVDPNRRLTDAERHRRAVAARREYFTRLALRSALTRSRRRVRGSTAQTEGGDQ